MPVRLGNREETPKQSPNADESASLFFGFTIKRTKVWTIRIPFGLNFQRLRDFSTSFIGNPELGNK